MNIGKSNDDRKKQRLANAQNILNTNMTANSFYKTNNNLNNNPTSQRNLNGERGSAFEDLQLNDQFLNQFQQKDNSADFSQKSNVMLPFDDNNQNMLNNSQNNINTQTNIMGNNNQQSSMNMIGGGNRNSNNTSQNNIIVTQNNTLITQNNTLVTQNNLITGNNKTQATNNKNVKAQLAPISSERGQIETSSGKFDINRLEEMISNNQTKVTQPNAITNNSNVSNKRQQQSNLFQKKQQRGQKQNNPSGLMQVKGNNSQAVNNNQTINDPKTKMNTDNMTSQNLLYNSKEIQETIDNGSGFEQTKGQNIHILDDEIDQNNNEKKGVLYPAKIINSQKRKSVYEDQIQRPPSKSTIEILGIICQAQAKLCVLICQGIRALSQKFENCVSKIFRSRVGSELIWLFGAVFICWLVYMGITYNSRDITDSNQYDSLKQYISNNIILGSFIFIAYGIIFLSIRNWTAYLLLFFFQAVPSLIIFMYYVYDTLKLRNRLHIPSPDYIQCAYIFGLYFFWMATFFVIKDLRESFNISARNFFMLFWCIVTAALVIGYTVYTVSTTWNLDFYWGDHYIKILAGPYILILALSWIYMHFSFFDPILQKVPDRQLAADENELEKLEQKKQQKKKYESVKVIIPDQDDEQHESFLKKQSSNEQHNQHEEHDDQEFLEEVHDAEGGGAFGITQQGDTIGVHSEKKEGEETPQDLTEEEKARLEQERLEAEEQERLRIEEEEKDNELREIEKRKLLLKIELRRDKPDPRMKVIMQNYSVIFCSCVFGGSLIVLTVNSMLNMAHDLQIGQDDNLFLNQRGFYLSVFYIFIVPIICLLGTALIFSQASDKIKLIVFPIIGGLVPVLFFMPFSVVTDLFYNLRPLKTFFAIGPCILGLYWVSLIFIKIKSIQFSMLLNGYICLFFIIPLLYILPQRSVDYYGAYDNIAQGIELALIIIGIILLLTLVFIDIFLEIRKRFRRRALKNKLKKEGRRQEIEEIEKEEFEEGQKFEISNIFKYDLYDFGLWGNAFGYIFTLTVLAFMYFNQPKWISLQQSGAIIGMQPVILLLFLISLIVLLLKIIPEKQKVAVSFSEQITQLVESKGERQITLDRQHKAKRTILMFSFVYAPIILGILIAVFHNNDEVKSNCITMIIGFPIVAIVFLLFYKLKQNFEGHARTAVPALVVFCWIFLYLPLAGILPSSVLYLSNDDESDVNYERLLLGFLIILLFLGIALFAIFIHLYFKRRDFEKKFLFIASKLIRKLAKVHVKSDYHVINLMYQGYISKGAEGIKEALINLQKPVYYAEVSDKDPDPRYSKIIIDAYAYEKLNKKEKTNPNKCWDKFVSWFFYIFCCCYKDYYARLMAQIAAERNKNGAGDGDGSDGNKDLQNIMDEALKKQQEQEEEEEQIIEEDPWLKKYIIDKKFRPIHEKIIEPLRRYDLGQQLEISKPWTDAFLRNVFYVFAQGSSTKFDGLKWKDYVMFKELLIKGGVIPCDEIQDHEIDIIYNKFTSVDGKPNKKPISYFEFPKILKEVAKRKYPFELDVDEALGKLCKNWLYPYLLWNLPPIRGLYRHEWDYVLFLLKLYGLDDLYKELIEEDEGFYYRLKKELGLMPKDETDDIILPDIDARMKNRKTKCQRCIERFNKYMKSLMENTSYFCKSLCLLDKDIKSNGKDEIDLEVNLINNDLLAPQQFGAKKKKNGQGYIHEESPEWPEIVDIMVDEIQHQEKQFARLKDKEIGLVELRSNFTNRFAIFFKILEYIGMAFIAFRPAVTQWGFSTIVYQVLNSMDTEIPNTNFSIKFGVGLGLSIAFFIFLYKSVQRIRTLRFGSCEQKNKKLYCSADFWQIQFLSMAGIAMMFWIFKILLDGMSCDYSVVPKYLYQQPDFICLEQKQITLIGLGVLGIFIFYPMASFLWPNVQYQNRSLDLRYDPTYLVISTQVKFLLAGGTAFLAHPDVQVYYFAFSTILLLLFAFLTNKMKPCLLKKVNPLDMGGYFLCGWFHLSALIVTATENTTIAWIVLAVGAFLICLLSLFNWKIIHDKDLAEREKRLANEKKDVNPEVQVQDQAEEVEIEQQEPEPVMDVDKVLYEEWDQQIKTYDPELLKITKELQETRKKRIDERNKKLKELERRQKLIAQMDKEDEEDGIKSKEKVPGEDGEDDLEAQKKKEETVGLQKKTTIKL
ncbi:transmembrane protein, putative (macronuclear) [Tetrahymena thermophila SB210]|uniref:Transmembrane protein, putative n=1 Tax=Tetrahymena thermophila (strain SB210) TaxID=312017 RepID=I7MEA6_TETTS|nr:transmembrane protein, putative [Tetrahymena thermophila SB210]EAR95963.2 transmembrane protein, putative [Tetrahymena thermophila SB210]|eukprot:XP_001016208.2 transmembrane protein, putative [Tetrahymena thermophila SB210]